VAFGWEALGAALTPPSVGGPGLWAVTRWYSGAESRPHGAVTRPGPPWDIRITRPGTTRRELARKALTLAPT
jgi:hypothetical protein